MVDEKNNIIGLVLGSGIDKDGNIPESAKARTRKALELYQSGEIQKVMFSGKWSYRADFIPPATEARAMADFGISIGLPREDILTEEESSSTVTNFYFIKKILVERGWNNLVFIINRPYVERACLNLEMVMGPGYKYKTVEPDFRFDSQKEIKLQELEKEKIKLAKNFYKNIRPGDDEAIYSLATEYVTGLGFNP